MQITGQARPQVAREDPRELSDRLLQRALARAIRRTVLRSLGRGRTILVPAEDDDVTEGLAGVLTGGDHEVPKSRAQAPAPVSDSGSDAGEKAEEQVADGGREEMAPTVEDASPEPGLPGDVALLRLCRSSGLTEPQMSLAAKKAGVDEGLEAAVVRGLDQEHAEALMAALEKTVT